MNPAGKIENEALGAICCIGRFLIRGGKKKKTDAPERVPTGAGVAVDIGAWLMKLTPTDLTVTTLVFLLVWSVGRFATVKFWPWLTEKYWPQREARLAKEAENNAQIEREQTTVLQTIRDVMVKFEVISEQNAIMLSTHATMLQRHDEISTNALGQINTKLDVLIEAGRGTK